MRAFLVSTTLLAGVLCSTVAFAGEYASEQPPPPPPLTTDEPAATEARPIVPALPPAFDGAAPTDARSEELDSLLPASLVTVGLGGVFVLTGGGFIAGERTSQYCGASGCVERPDDYYENLGASFMGAGIGFALVGGTGLLGWLGSHPRGTEQRASEPLMLSGFSLVAISAAAFGVGVGQAVTYGAYPAADLSTSWQYWLTSGLTAAVGIPLLAAGATKSTAAERAEKIRKAEYERTHPRKGRRSIGMMVAGGVLVGLGGLAGLAGTALSIATRDIIVTFIIGLPLVGGGGLFMSIGLPLLIVGLQHDKVPASTTQASSEAIDLVAAEAEEEARARDIAKFIPEVSTYGVGVALTWRLP
ncbi:MAG: hypothetical protein U0271_41550 [Polyangiaceae bacterium]